MGRARRALDRDGRWPGEAADPRDRAEDHGDDAQRSADRRQPPPEAEPSAARHDRVEVRDLLAVPAVRGPECPPQGVEVAHGCSPRIVEAEVIRASAPTRSFASARELVLLTVPREMPRS
jgi:hypothetical protein